MDEYTGELVGGPQEGILLTTSRLEIPVLSTTDFWLDGLDGIKTTYAIKGKYIFDEDKEQFTWTLEDYLVFNEDGALL